ncbi:Ig-like domain-containing protein [Paenibacillus sp. WC2504]|uniref:Ig-like domain-containing protein n=1 Tax=Paenibacillus sp. WC2504 TaxID=3461403 RepID=UPI0040460ADF
MRNNVFYNWGANSGYGGENATGVNVVNNYYKAGPATFDDVKNRVFNPWSEQPGNYYIEGNYVDGYPEISSNNWAGGVQPEYGLGTVNRLQSPVPITYKNTDGTTVDTSVTTDSATDTYDKVLEHAGAILPKRDSLDARIVNDVRNGLGKFANTPDGDGGFPALTETTLSADYDSDHDGIPNLWEEANGLDANNTADGKADSGDGFTYLEKYLNSLLGNGSNNPAVAITSPSTNAMLQANQDIVIDATASDSDGTVAKVEFSFYDTQAMKLVPLGTVTSAPYSYTWTNAPEGTHYLYAKATDNSGTQTLSSMVAIHVNGSSGIGAWTSADIGSVTIPGTSSVSGDESSSFIVKGTGKIGATSDGIQSKDAFQYTYRDISGDMELSSTINFQNPSEYDNGVKSGLMIRQDLTADSPFAMITVMKEEYYGTRIHFMSRSARGDLVVTTAKPNVELPALLKISRYGNEVKGLISIDGGANWEVVGSVTLDLPDHAYIGMAVDATKSTNNFNYYNSSLFKNTKLRTDNITGDVFTTGNLQLNENDGDPSVSVQFSNRSELDKNGVLVIALYDADGSIVNYSYTSDLVEGQGIRTLTANFQLPEDAAGYKLKAFVWDQLANKQVISNVAELALTQ